PLRGPPAAAVNRTGQSRVRRRAVRGGRIASERPPFGQGLWEKSRGTPTVSRGGVVEGGNCTERDRARQGARMFRRADAPAVRREGAGPPRPGYPGSCSARMGGHRGGGAFPGGAPKGRRGRSVRAPLTVVRRGTAGC